MIVDQVRNWRSYPLGRAWEQAFAFLDSLTPDAEEKEYSIDGDAIFARVMRYRTRSEMAADAVLESHRTYADIQVALSGAERIAVYPGAVLSVKTPYDAERDVEFYRYEAPGPTQLVMRPGTFALLLPQDAHMPQLDVDTPGAEVKKVVVKVALRLLLAESR